MLAFDDKGGKERLSLGMEADDSCHPLVKDRDGKPLFRAP